MACLYQITSPSGKSYLGISSKTAEERFLQHKANAFKYVSDTPNALYSAMKKYGSDNFKIRTLVEGSFSYVRDLEIAAIRSFNTRPPYGYNLSAGGEGSTGVVPTVIARKRMSTAQKRIMKDPLLNQVRLMGLAKAVKVRQAKWYAMSDEERAQWSADHKERLEKANRFTPEVRAIMSLKGKGRDKGKKKSDEVRKNMSAAAKERWSRKGEKEKASFAAYQRWGREHAKT